MQCWRRWLCVHVLLVIAGGVCLSAAPTAIGGDPDSQRAAKEGIVRRLAHQEELVRTCECLVTYRKVVTDPNMIPLIEAYCHKVGKTPKKYIYTKEKAAINSRAIHWWRKGIKERVEKFGSLDAIKRADVTPLSIEVFDGTVGRGYSPNGDGGQPLGKVIRAKTWLNREYDDPFALIYEYGHRRLSGLLESSSDFRITDADGQTTVSFAIPRVKNHRMVLVLNRDGLIVHRDLLTPNKKFGPEPRIYERQSYSYRTYRDESGESVAFPSVAEISHVLPTSDGGSLITYSRDLVEITSFQFNQPIPDEMFAIQFPENTNVIDHVSGRRSPDITMGQAATAGATRRRWWTLLAVNVAVLAMMASGLAVWRWRRH
jgi:hypothetical protein